MRDAGIFAAGMIAGLVVAVAARGSAPGASQPSNGPGSPPSASSVPPSAEPTAPGGVPPRPTAAAPVTREGARFSAHLRVAPDLWARVVDAARASERARALVAELEAHRAALPSPEPQPPAAADAYLTRSRALLDRAASAGVDAAELSVTIDALRRPGLAGPSGPTLSTASPSEAGPP